MPLTQLEQIPKFGIADAMAKYRNTQFWPLSSLHCGGGGANPWGGIVCAG